MYMHILSMFLLLFWQDARELDPKQIKCAL